jgi:hypothetical protein
MVPEMLQVCDEVVVKLAAVALAPFMVTDWLGGLNVSPLWLGVTV